MRHFQRSPSANGGHFYRALVPVLPWIRTGYDPLWDHYRHGVWVWYLIFGVEVDSRPGFGLSIRWGWVERSTVIVGDGSLHG